MKKKDTLVCYICDIESPEFRYGLSKILVKKKDTLVCYIGDIESPEF